MAFARIVACPPGATKPRAADLSLSPFRREPWAVFLVVLLLQIGAAQSGATFSERPCAVLLVACHTLAVLSRVNDLHRFARLARRNLRALAARSALPTRKAPPPSPASSPTPPDRLIALGATTLLLNCLRIAEGTSAPPRRAPRR